MYSYSCWFLISYLTFLPFSGKVNLMICHVMLFLNAFNKYKKILIHKYHDVFRESYYMKFYNLNQRSVKSPIFWHWHSHEGHIMIIKNNNNNNNMLDHMTMIWQISFSDINEQFCYHWLIKFIKPHFCNILCFQLLWCSILTPLTVNLYCLKIWQAWGTKMSLKRKTWLVWRGSCFPLTWRDLIGFPVFWALWAIPQGHTFGMWMWETAPSGCWESLQSLSREKEPPVCPERSGASAMTATLSVWRLLRSHASLCLGVRNRSEWEWSSI